MNSASRDLFFAIRPDAASAARIGEVRDAVKRQGCRGSWLRPDKYHITTHFLGDLANLPADMVERAKAVAAELRCPPLAIDLDRVESFQRPRRPPCVLRCAAAAERLLQGFREHLTQRLEQAAVKVIKDHRFTPHLTLGYTDTRLAAPIAVEPVVWCADEFVLLISHVGLSQHEVVGRWPFRADAAPLDAAGQPGQPPYGTAGFDF